MDYKVFYINNSFASGLDNNGKPFPYVQFLQKTIFEDLNVSDKRILVLGAGGFTFTHNIDLKNNEVTYVDIDKSIKPLAEDLFLEQPINGNFIVHDARIFLSNKGQKWDIIIVDLYSNLNSVPWHLTTIEFFEEIKSSLSENGMAFMNVISLPTMNDPYSQRIDQTIRHVFSNCRANTIDYKPRLTNVVYGCFNVKKNHLGIYTDHQVQSTIDSTLLSMRSKIDDKT